MVAFVMFLLHRGSRVVGKAIYLSLSTKPYIVFIFYFNILPPPSLSPLLNCSCWPTAVIVQFGSCVFTKLDQHEIALSNLLKIFFFRSGRPSLCPVFARRGKIILPLFDKSDGLQM